jgi:hypothetical protein
MALYVPVSRRRRRVIGITAVALVVGLLLGLVLGRLFRPSVQDEVDARQRDTQQLVARLDGLALEYEQTGTAGQAASDAREGSVDAARGISADARKLLDDVPWLGERQRAEAVSAVQEVQAAIESNASVDDVKHLVDDAESALQNAVGLEIA